jgi:hypothetical protein
MGKMTGQEIQDAVEMFLGFLDTDPDLWDGCLDESMSLTPENKPIWVKAAESMQDTWKAYPTVGVKI